MALIGVHGVDWRGGGVTTMGREGERRGEEGRVGQSRGNNVETQGAAAPSHVIKRKER